jgi:hypothetical protein
LTNQQLARSAGNVCNIPDNEPGELISQGLDPLLPPADHKSCNAENALLTAFHPVGYTRCGKINAGR